MLKTFLKNYIDSNYPQWDISIALRYLPVIDEIKKQYDGTQSILEVGSEITGITTYLPVKVTGLDMDFDYSRQNEFLNPVKGSVLKLPFEKESFDYVISVDMLEHIRGDKRKKAVEEMMRVAKYKVIAAFPSGKDSEMVDQKLFDYFVATRGEEYQYLREHVDLGLPDADEVLGWMKGDRVKVSKKPNTSLWLWERLLKMGLSGEQVKSSWYRRLLLALPILKYFNFGKVYRQVLVAEKVH